MTNMEEENANPRAEGKAIKKSRAKPGRKRMGKDVFVPVTIKVEPSELSTIEMIAKASKRSRSDVMREMVTLGMEQMLESAFAPKDERESGKAGATGAPDRDASVVEIAHPDDAHA